MQREIKFKFIIDNKHLSKSYSLKEIIEQGISKENILEDMEECNCDLNESNNHCEGGCIRFENSEITGFRDKEGKDVYSGDTSKEGEYVDWNVRAGCWGMFKDGRVMSYPIDIDRLLIIGNIYENK